MQLAVAALLVTGVWTSCKPKEAESNNVPVEASNSMVVNMPAMELKNLEGQTVSLESFKGKKVFVNLWASWCPPCRKELPSIQELHSGTDTSKVAFVLLSLDNTFEEAKDFSESNSLTLPVYYPAGKLPSLFSVESIPTTFIFNEKGELIKRVDGAEDYATPAFKSLLM